MNDTPRSDTPETDKVRHNVAELAMHSRKLERENNELRKDKERLDWLLGDEPIYSNYRKVAVNNRDDIDEAMEKEA